MFSSLDSNFTFALRNLIFALRFSKISGICTPSLQSNQIADNFVPNDNIRQSAVTLFRIMLVMGYQNGPIISIRVPVDNVASDH